MRLLYFLLVATVVFTAFSAGMFLLSAQMLGLRVRARQMLLFCAAENALMWAGNLIEMLTGYPISENLLVWDIGMFTLYGAVLTALLCKVCRTPILKTGSAVALSHFVTFTATSVAAEALAEYMPALESKYLYLGILNVAPHLMGLLFAVLAAEVLRRTNFARAFSYLFAGKARAAASATVCLLLMHARALAELLLPGSQFTAASALASFILIVLSLFGIQLAAVVAAGREKLLLQEETIAQQRAQLRLLEELRQEVRAFRHDFANLVSGMAISAQAGDAQGLRDFLQRTSGYFDERLGTEIQRLTCLQNVGPDALRSLLAVKLCAMRERGVRCELEVLRPVTACGLNEADLLRCMGVLLDNALEAAPREDGRVRAVLLQEEHALFIAISNNCAEAPDLSRMQQKRYTTKGAGHGNGLMSYRRILARYPGCVARTYLRDGFITQELRVPLTGGERKDA